MRRPPGVGRLEVLAAGVGAVVGLARLFDRLLRRRLLRLLLAVRRLRLDPPHDAVHQLAAGAAGHVLGHPLVLEGRELLPALAAAEQLRLERAVTHLLQQRAEERLGDPGLRLLDQLLVLGLADRLRPGSGWVQ